MLVKENQSLISWEGKQVQLKNLDKVFWPKQQITKQDVIEYYLAVSAYILPYLNDRLQILHRNPNGILDRGFYQKNVKGVPPWFKTKTIINEGDQRTVRYALCNDEASLIYLVNWGCIEFNCWLSRLRRINFPDYLVLDLDPLNVPFVSVIETALQVKVYLSELGLKSYCKTSGKRGMHILIPTGGKYTFYQVRVFAKKMVQEIHNRIPQLTSIERLPKKREYKVYLDYLQNSFGQSIVAPYSLRPWTEASVSMPLEWEELNYAFDPFEFNIKTAKDRYALKGDLFKGLIEPAENDVILLGQLMNVFKKL